MKTNNHNQEVYALNSKNHKLIKKLEVAAIITVVTGVLSIIALLFTFLALCDIGNQEPDLSLEWNIVGIGLIIWIIFIVSTLVTLTYFFRMIRL